MSITAFPAPTRLVVSAMTKKPCAAGSSASAVLPTLHLTVNNIWVKGWPGHTTVFAQWDGTATLLNGATSYVNRGLHGSPCGGAESMHSRNFKIHKQRPVLLPPKQQPASKRLSPNKL